MDCAYFRFHDELSFFLPRRLQQTTIAHSFDWRGSIKDMIESLGVPHSEIELIVVNDQSVNFNYIVQPDDQIHVYPRYESAALADKVRLRPPLLCRPSFVLDQHLGEMMGDAPMCDTCGHITVRNGACYKCLNCGASMGCS